MIKRNLYTLVNPQPRETSSPPVSSRLLGLPEQLHLGLDPQQPRQQLARLGREGKPAQLRNRAQGLGLTPSVYVSSRSPSVDIPSRSPLFKLRSCVLKRMILYTSSPLFMHTVLWSYAGDGRGLGVDLDAGLAAGRHQRGELVRRFSARQIGARSGQAIIYTHIQLYIYNYIYICICIRKGCRLDGWAWSTHATADVPATCRHNIQQGHTDEQGGGTTGGGPISSY